MFQCDVYDTVLETNSEKIEISMIEERLRKSVMSLNLVCKDLFESTIKCSLGEIDIIHEGMVQIMCIDNSDEFIKIK